MEETCTEEQGSSGRSQYLATQNILAVGVVFILVCLLLFQYGFQLYDILVVFLLFGLPAEYFRRRGQSRGG